MKPLRGISLPLSKRKEIAIGLNGTKVSWDLGQQREASLRICSVFQSLDILNLVLFLPLVEIQNITRNCEFRSSLNKVLVQWLFSISEKKVPLIFLPLNQKYPHPLMNSDAYMLPSKLLETVEVMMQLALFKRHESLKVHGYIFSPRVIYIKKDQDMVLRNLYWSSSVSSCFLYEKEDKCVVF